MSDEEYEREMDKLKAHLSILEEVLQKYEEDQRYGWTMKKNKVKWHSLQVYLRKRMYARLKEGFRTPVYEMEVCIC